MRADEGFVEAWSTALVARHTRELSRPEFLKAARALSARYVERRSTLRDRSPLDSVGKRAAFAGLYAPLHALTTRAIVQALGPACNAISHLVDLGCGTGAASAGWMLASLRRPSVFGVDRDSWALREAAWTWKALGVRGKTRRGNFVAAAGELAIDAARGRLRAGTAVVLGWSVNELDGSTTESLLASLCGLAGHGAALLVIEPVAARVVPWWDDWRRALAPFQPRADMWSFDDAIPAAIADLREAAGFRGTTLDARSLWIGPPAR